MTYQTAFPDYDNANALAPLIAAGWRDESWHNDVCPSFTKGRCAIFVDYLAADKREVPESPICTVIVVGDDGCYSDVSQSFDSVPAAILFADEVTNELRGGESIDEVVKWARFRLQLTTESEARELLDGETDSEVIAYLESCIPVERATLGGFATSGNIAPIGRALRDGTLDTFQARAILSWMSPERWNKFAARWNVA